MPNSYNFSNMIVYIMISSLHWLLEMYAQEHIWVPLPWAFRSSAEMCDATE